ncbi:hypothetical protein PENSPDRAFT_752992 [Peniophora sp. CONT]|nr:hypothetical protein PENSPDRAFT_752992 [Peniophora sp. CONT]
MSLGTKFNPKDVCNWCHKEQGRDNLRVCGGCRMVRYCSRNCQRGAWKTHKFSCSQNQQLVASLREDPVQESFNSLLTRWLTVWKPFLVMHGPIAYDLANSPRNKMQTHCVFFDIESRPNEKQVAKAFTMLRGGCIPKTAWADRLRADGNGDFADNFLEDDRGQDTATLCFWVTRHDSDDPTSGLVRQLYFSMRDGGNFYRKWGKEESRQIVEGWAEAAAFTIEEGNHTKLLKPSSGLKGLDASG